MMAGHLFKLCSSLLTGRDPVAILVHMTDSFNDTDPCPRSVCYDCFIAHHYGATMIERVATDDESHAWHGGYLRGHDLPNVVEETEHGLIIREWFAGESDAPCDREPLGLIDESAQVTDWTDSESGAGIVDFSWSRCEGCGSTLGGARYRLAILV